MNFKSLLLTFLSLLLIQISTEAQIQAGKAINITISNVPDEDKVTVTGVYPVSENGMINMPHIGLVRAAGLQSQDLANSLQTRYKTAGIYTNPTIQVITNAQDSQVDQETVTVGGQVRRPGPVPFGKDLTLWQAVQAAGGATEFGSMKRVILFRDGKQKPYDLTQAQFMRVPLQRNDTIDVPQKNAFGR